MATTTSTTEYATEHTTGLVMKPDASGTSADTVTGGIEASLAAVRVTVLYFASLREAAGCERETLHHAGDLAALYEALRARHGFVLPRERLRVALDGAFARWDDAPGEGAEVAFIPPVSGG